VVGCDEIIVDNFAGGGGASTGIATALGRAPDVAVNHDAEAVVMHAANHPDTLHLCGDVWEYDPREIVRRFNGRRVGLLWASPDCKHFSKAKGGQLVRSKKIRALAWVVVRWAKTVRPRVIILENVEEFQTWGPLDDAGRPDVAKRGVTFRRWQADLRSAGYVVEMRMLRACDYGAPTTRRRLFIIARCDGEPIVWPTSTHGPGRLPFRTAAECIDWSLPCPSIFDRKRPLAENTLRRIARGIQKFVLGAAKPFVVPSPRALVAPSMIAASWGERAGQAPRVHDLHAPMPTIVAGGVKQALVAAFLAKHYGGHEGAGAAVTTPFATITCKDHHALVRAFLTKYYGETDAGARAGQAVNESLHTITTEPRFGLVTVEGEKYEIRDIGMRMLTPRELFRSQGFDDSYVIDPVFNGKRLSITAQVRMCGNSVSPPMAAALVAANFAAPATRVAA
jgi:DNA (cytosine-5)-methyltransferase 1